MQKYFKLWLKWAKVQFSPLWFTLVQLKVEYSAETSNSFETPGFVREKPRLCTTLFAVAELLAARWRAMCPGAAPEKAVQLTDLWPACSTYS